MISELRCPQCGDELIVNNWGNSIPYYDCRRRGWSSRYANPCDFKISVKDFEAKYQGEMTRLERIRKKFNVGFYKFHDSDGREDMAFLLRELEKDFEIKEESL